MSNHPPTTPCISSQEMLDYTLGILSPKEQHRIEKHLLDCEFCSDALEGMEMMENPKELLKIEDELNFDIDALISVEEENVGEKVKVLFPWRIAAAVVLLLVSTITLFIILPKQNSQKLALENSQPYPAPKEAVSEPMQDNTTMKVPNEQSAPSFSKNNTPTVASREITKSDSPSESVTAEKDMQSDELYSNQATAAALANEESGRKAEFESTKTQIEDESQETNSKTETSVSEVAISLKKSPARAATSSEAAQDVEDVVQMTDSYKVNTDDLYKMGIKEYKNKKYLAAISLLDKCTNKPEARFYAGVSYFLIDNPHLALSNLEKYIQTNQAQYREASFWYSGLSYLKLENKAAAKQAFEKVIPFKGEFQKQAAEMLKSL
jgi:tetratricopeptide (TPR) repeat protein